MYACLRRCFSSSTILHMYIRVHMHLRIYHRMHVYNTHMYACLRRSFSSSMRRCSSSWARRSSSASFSDINRVSKPAPSTASPSNITSAGFRMVSAYTRTHEHVHAHTDTYRHIQTHSWVSTWSVQRVGRKWGFGCVGYVAGLGVYGA